MSYRLLTAAFLAMITLPASASSSQWHESEGGAVRLVTAGEPDAQGKLRAALDIRLKPGWKTYWRDPGPSGIPPQIDLSGDTHVEAAEIFYPPPVRIDDGYSQGAGYASSVALPVTFTLEHGNAPALIEAEVLLGICETICIPMKADITLDPASEPEELRDRALVSAAYSALPTTPSTQFGLQSAAVEGEKLMVTATVPAGAGPADIFIASGEGYLFGQPVQVGRDATQVTFIVELHKKPESPSLPAEIAYTLTAGKESVAGTFRIP